MQEESGKVTNLPIENKTTPKSTWRSAWELARFGFVAIFLVLSIRIFLAEPFVVSGSSMFPTFIDGDYLIVDKLSYRVGNPERDDVVVFKYPNDTTKYFIKRIIGLPNETVDIKGSTVTITNEKHKDGLKIDEPFVETPGSSNVHYQLKDDEYFVMGDNRTASSDSRYWGPVKRGLLTGRALFRLLPIKNADVLPGAYKQEE